ncbi:hypothetical protein HW555_003495 [Spodoptera exigua]|uniref:ABC transporter domain-containing protein n=1 Tax=Spodoptera exigua TaxID=7107 RepID=A0A835L9A0_SPOEX|nr:hypothetical protein HW555_003495 [Spodoptera exigua]
MYLPENKKGSGETKKPIRNRFQRHTSILIWKCYLQRQRRAGLLLVEAVFSIALFFIAILISKPVFLTPLQDEPEPPLASGDILASLHTNNILGYAPNNQPFVSIMHRAGILLGLEIMSAQTEDDLNEMLYNRSSGAPLRSPENNIWTLSIRSTERARFVTSSENRETSNPHLRAGFLAVQLAISQAIIEHSSIEIPDFEVTLVSMPVSPLMEEGAVRQALSAILLCFTLALIPPVLETEALVVNETVNSFKRALRLRNVGYATMYVSWLVYAYLTCLPICVLASITLILIFRWIHLFAALLVVMAYASVMIMLALMMGMFHSKASIACVWTTLFTLMQTYLAELLVHHEYDLKHSALTFVLHLILPPIGLVHALNKFALLQTGHESISPETSSLVYMVMSWCIMNIFYFGVLMMLQRTIGQKRAIGGQVSWSSIIFKKVEDRNQLHTIEAPTRSERGKVQQVDELVAKAISFRDSIMGVPVLSDITFDIYRGEFTVLFAERIQDTMLNTMEDLLTGLTFADHGTITVLGERLEHGTVVMTSPHMMGYCHHSETLIEDLTVQEHFTLFSMICLWNRMKLSIFEYAHVRTKRLLKECDLEKVKNERVRNLNIYYKAQLCWAIAMLLEPRVIVIPALTDHRTYVSVIKDKIMQYKKYKTIVSLNFSSMQIEYADRIFVFDSKILVFGGTPAYMFFKYGREYRVRMTMKSGISDDTIKELLNRAEQAGATVRAHLGSLLILRLPASPTATVAELVKDLTDNSNKYGLTSFNISVADSEEVCRRAIMDSRLHVAEFEGHTSKRSKRALSKIMEPVKWTRQKSFYNIHLGSIGYKFFAFHIFHKLLFAITLLAAITAGAALGFSLSSVLFHMDPGRGSKKVISGEMQVLSVESLEIYTTLVLRADNSSASQSIAHGYVLSDTKATQNEIENIEYTSLPHTESLTEYLVTRAIDSPQVYVYMYAYGMDVSTDANGTVNWLKDVTTPPLFIQFMLILTISHITLLPSKEYGLIRHIQKHAINFSPTRYWLTLYFFDLILYWMLVGVMSVIMITIMLLTIPMTYLNYVDLFIVPFMLTVYGIGCVPQAYIFSLGPRMALNTMTFVIVNLVFGETTILAKIFYGDVFSYAVDFMSLSPQFNMAYAFVKIKQIFLYNSECVIFKARNLCPMNTFHKCCEKCGVLQDCFSTKSYFTRYPGVMMEVIATCTTAVFFTIILLLIEYRIFYRLWNYGTAKLGNRDKPAFIPLTPGSQREQNDVIEKKQQIKKHKHNEKVDTFGDYILASNVAKRIGNFYAVHNLFLGIGRGEALALSGLKAHGRTTLGEILAGYTTPDVGNVWAMSKYKLRTQPHKYSQQVSVSCDRDLLPSWMGVSSALELIAALRGVPRKFIKGEVKNYIKALELEKLANQYVEDIHANDRTRIHFAAAVIGAPPTIVLDECTAYQDHSVRRAMYSILNALRKRGHAIFISSSSIESHMPVTNKLAIMLDGHIYDVDSVDNMVERYSKKGYTVVVHLKDEVDVTQMFSRYFVNFVINDTTEVLVNIQVLDTELTWAGIFEKMEALKADNQEVYSYIVTVIPIDYIYNTIINKSSGNYRATGLCSWKWFKKLMSVKPEIVPKKRALKKLIPFEQKYDITKLTELPWSVIFHR